LSWLALETACGGLDLSFSEAAQEYMRSTAGNDLSPHSRFRRRSPAKENRL